jgi:hypothetical protein
MERRWKVRTNTFRKKDFTTPNEERKPFHDLLRRSLIRLLHDVMYRAQQTRSCKIEDIWRECPSRALRQEFDAGKTRGTGQHQHAKFAEGRSRSAKYPFDHHNPNSTCLALFLETTDAIRIKSRASKH